MRELAFRRACPRRGVWPKSAHQPDAVQDQLRQMTTCFAHRFSGLSSLRKRASDCSAQGRRSRGALLPLELTGSSAASPGTRRRSTHLATRLTCLTTIDFRARG